MKQKTKSVNIALPICSLLVPLLFLFTSARAQDNSLHFDGVDDYLDLNHLASDLSNANNNFTIEFWLKADALNLRSANRVVLFAVNQAVGGGDNEFLIIMGGTGTTQEGRLIIYDERVSGSKFVLISTEVIGDGECHHISYVRDGSTGEAFIDGQSIGSYTARYQFQPFHRYSIGQDWDNTSNSEFYRGSIDEVRIWTTARTSNQINTNKDASINASEPDLLVRYSMNQGVAGANNTAISSVFDASGSGHHATMSGFQKTGANSNWIMDTCHLTELQLTTISRRYCFGDSTTFELVGNTDSIVFWNFGDPSTGGNNTARGELVKHVFSDTGSFLVKTYTNDPRFTDTIIEVIRITRISFDLGADTSLCEDSILQLQVNHPYDSLRWSTGGTTPSIQVSQSGMYKATAWLGGCQFTDSILVNFDPPPVFDLGPDEILCLEDSVILRAPVSRDSLVWTDGDRSASRIIKQNGNYSLTVYRNGCSYTDDVSFSFQNCNCMEDFILPNAFSPNDDAINETFPPIFDCPISYYRLRIYNRWGEKLVDTNNPSYKWDGVYMGQKCPLGVYLYMLDIESHVQRISKSTSGTVHLMK
ncbi:MAG: gliding motility-associated C-terminal domain-containing protein [Bacteroidia bacterium]|nr:gliding motility-associated C-terminal domain-containing protein [Bacteroidia bacterium]